MLDSAVLLLNQNFEPLTTTSARRAIVMVLTGKAEIVEGTRDFVRSVSRTFNIPSIIRLLMFVRFAHRWNIQLTRQNILRRDLRTCQYCGRKEGVMTVDHVVPRSIGGGDTWENLVCACSQCNNRKGDRTLDMAGMSLNARPKKPSIRSFLFLSRGPIRKTWRTYLRTG